MIATLGVFAATSLGSDPTDDASRRPAITVEESAAGADDQSSVEQQPGSASDPAHSDSESVTSPTTVTNVAARSFPVAESTAPDGIDAGDNPVSYDADNLVDGRLDTTWRTNGDATGQSLALSFDEPVVLTQIGLVNGYAKVDPYDGTDRYSQERRVLSVTWTFEDGTTIAQELVDGSREVQAISVPPTRTSQVSVRITATTDPGEAGYDYTAVAEIVLLGD